MIREITPERMESKINWLIWTFEMEGITLTREEAEKAIRLSLSRPLPEFGKRR